MVSCVDLGDLLDELVVGVVLYVLFAVGLVSELFDLLEVLAVD